MKLQTSISIILLCACFSTNAFGQKDKKETKDAIYTQVDTDIYGQEGSGGTTVSVNSFFFGSSFDFALSTFTNIALAGFADRQYRQNLEMSRKQSVTKRDMIKEQYAGYSEFPVVITDGWHNAIATDNSNFCKDVKVLVKNNRVVKFVIDNYIPIKFMPTGQIKNCKNMVTLNNFNGEQLTIVELYFIYDLEQTTLVSEPLKPGFICFWTDVAKYDDIEMTFDNVRMEKFSVRFNQTPDCFSNGMICRILKPGTYSFIADGKGHQDWKGTVEIKENMCLKYHLGTQNTNGRNSDF